MLPWRSAVGPSIPVGKSSSEAWGGVEEVWDEVVEVLAEGIDERRLEMVRAPAEASSARLSSSRRGKEMREREGRRDK